MGRGLLTELSTASVDECRCCRGASIGHRALPPHYAAAGGAYGLSRPHRLQVENQARPPTAPRGIGNDINEKSAPQDAHLTRNPNPEDCYPARISAAIRATVVRGAETGGGAGDGVGMAGAQSLISRCPHTRRVLEMNANPISIRRGAAAGGSRPRSRLAERQGRAPLCSVDSWLTVGA